MINRFTYTALALAYACLPAQAVIVTYTYNSRAMVLPYVSEGYSVNGNNIGNPGPMNFSFVIAVELDAVGGTLAHARIIQGLDSNRGVTTIASRNGIKLAVQNSEGGGWFSGGFYTDSYSFAAALDFDANANVGDWYFLTDSENQFASFGGGYGDSFGRTSFSDWQPYPPVWTSSGPGTWTRSDQPSPVPLPATAMLLSVAVFGLGVIRAQTRKIVQSKS